MPIGRKNRATFSEKFMRIGSIDVGCHQVTLNDMPVTIGFEFSQRQARATMRWHRFISTPPENLHVFFRQPGAVIASTIAADIFEKAFRDGAGNSGSWLAPLCLLFRDELRGVWLMQHTTNVMWCHI